MDSRLSRRHGPGFQKQTDLGLMPARAKVDIQLSSGSLQAEAIVETFISELSGVPGVRSIQPAGSFRRRRETIGDLDLVAETDRPLELVERFTTLGSVESVIGKGPHKAAVRLLRSPQVDLMIMPPGEAATYLIHFTGSKEHNVRLRGMARDIGWSLSEKGYLKLRHDGEPAIGELAEPAERPGAAGGGGMSTENSTVLLGHLAFLAG
jgi:DNA polymerase (family 10)